MSETGSRPVTRPGSSAGRDDSTVVNGNGTSTPKYGSMVAASENRVKFADFEGPGASSSGSSQDREQEKQQPDVTNRQAGEGDEDAPPSRHRHRAEVPRSDPRGEVLSFDEGDTRVTEGADGRIIKEKVGSTMHPDHGKAKGSKQDPQDLSIEERDVGLTAEEWQEAREVMSDDLTEEQKIIAYKEKRMRRDVG